MTNNDVNQNQPSTTHNSGSASGMSIAAMVCGICGIVVSIIVGIFGIIFGTKVKKEAPKGSSSYTFGNVGVVCGWISLTVTLLVIVLVIIACTVGL